MTRNRIYTAIFGLIVLIAIVGANLWTADIKNYFLADDYWLLNEAHFNSADEIFNFLPVMKYNDRPVGRIIINVLHELFGMRSQIIHSVLLLTHVINAFLVFLLAKRVLRDFGKAEYVYLPFLAAASFGIWPKSLHAVSWLAAVFDLFGVTFFLLILILFVYRTASKWRYLNEALMAVLFIIALRTKEMVIVAPLLMLAYEALRHLYKNQNVVSSLKKFRPSRISIVLLLIAIAYFLFITFGVDQEQTTDPTAPYFYTYNPLIILKDFAIYCYMYFDYSRIEGSQGIFVGYNSIASTVSLAVLAPLFLISIVQLFRKKYLLFFMFVALFIALAPVLPLKNTHHVLYLYMPSIFLGLLLATVLAVIVKKLARNNTLHLIVMIAAVAGLYSLTSFDSVKVTRSYRWMMGQNNLTTAQDIAQLPKPPANSTVYLTNVSDGFSSLVIGGKIVNLIFDDPSIVTVLNPETIKKDSPYMVLEYSSPSGKITLLEHSFE
jgi:hypothetical protein